MDPEKRINCIVLDAAPLLLNQPSISTLLATAEEIYTVPSVVAEIRDPNARQRLETTILPFLNVRTPCAASLETVAGFARKTGDFSVLSRPDLQILALAYELECERNHGDWRLRRTPGQKRLNGSPPAEVLARNKPQDLEERNETSDGPLQFQSMSREGGDDSHKTNEAPERQSEEADNQAAQTPFVPAAVDEDPKSVDKDMSLVNQLDGLSIERKLEAATQPDGASAAIDSADFASESDGGEWITPSNLRKHQQKDKDAAVRASSASPKMQVATITTDFALQNTLLMMNLNLLAASLSRVSHLRSHILRCHACFATTKEMSRQFCDRCGGATLTRVTCTTSANGEFKLHLKNNMQWSHRGDRYSVPKPVAGTSSGKLGKGGRGKGGKGGWGRELVLSEDQKEYTRAVSSQERQRSKDLMDPDYLPSILTGERGPGGKIIVGAGRNVNSRKR